jgi:hypothetical protein
MPRVLGLIQYELSEGRFRVFQFFYYLSKQDLALRQLPAFSISFVIASLFYRFGSFALECLAFLATWFVVDAVAQLLVGLRRRTTEPVAEAGPGR